MGKAAAVCVLRPWEMLGVVGGKRVLNDGASQSQSRHSFHIILQRDLPYIPIPRHCSMDGLLVCLVLTRVFGGEEGSSTAEPKYACCTSTVVACSTDLLL